LVKKESRVLGGICVLYHERRAFYWHGAYLREAFEYRAPNFIQSEVMREACGRGVQWFDLGISAGMEGVVRFKDSFGAQRLFFERGVIGRSPVFESAFRIRSAIRKLTGR
jgi:lipid II:glycine glycyltransferase (peptidoglycan interpeptide bridge formation enzyme)